MYDFQTSKIGYLIEYPPELLIRIQSDGVLAKFSRRSETTQQLDEMIQPDEKRQQMQKLNIPPEKAGILCLEFTSADFHNAAGYQHSINS
ncbi:MAG: hypothetical protein ACK526_21495 [Planctomyces sp.]|jgi:hypothetical protein